MEVSMAWRAGARWRTVVAPSHRRLSTLWLQQPRLNRFVAIGADPRETDPETEISRQVQSSVLAPTKKPFPLLPASDVTGLRLRVRDVIGFRLHVRDVAGLRLPVRDVTGLRLPVRDVIGFRLLVRDVTGLRLHARDVTAPDPFVSRLLLCCNDVESNPGPLASNDDNSSTGSNRSVKTKANPKDRPQGTDLKKLLIGRKVFGQFFYLKNIIQNLGIYRL
jgi:hypothetical protein